MSTSITLTPNTPLGGDDQALITGSGGGAGIHLLPGFRFPVTVDEGTWAESPATEGRRRIRTRPLNSTGSGEVRIQGSTGAVFWGYVDAFQQTVAAMNRYGGELTFTGHQGDEITYEVEAMNLSPETNLDRLTEVQHAVLGFTFECKPYGLLAEETLI